ncbi:lysophospholipase [Sphingobium jiangsuense]|uniref:Lysophospholipase n=1 Tax=Sphingobium jiangsuense TaxID=870476 RepID=A0A7W6FNB7_9SPHN|nr:alpha/beta hydrolase [Sphingobium jiangsuense]MBB3924643.1 lysophospholipase [Sphingobium jiangsuense]
MTTPPFPTVPDDAVTFWRAKDGWPIRAARLFPPESAPRRGSILFLNGRADHIEKYAEAIRGWADEGWVVDGFDWRGQGGSGRVAPAPMLGHIPDFELWLDDLRGYAADWRAATPGPHVVIGHSMGGHLLLRALAEGRVECDAAVLIAPMLGLVAGGVPHAVARRLCEAVCALGLSERPLWPERSRTPEREAALRERLTHSVERFAQEQAIRQARPDLAMDAPSWGWLRAAYHSIERLEAPGLLERVATPVLILASRADRLVAAPAIEQVARRLPSAQVHFYGAEAAHEILREADPVRDDALARIGAFLEDHAPPVAAAAEGR